MNNFSKRLSGLTLGLLLSLGVGVIGGQHDVINAEAGYTLFDLKTKTQITESTSSSLVFTAGSQVFSIAKNTASTATNNHCPASIPAMSETIAYKGSIITIDAGPGNLIMSAKFLYWNGNSYSFVSFAKDTWTGATYDNNGSASPIGDRQTISVLLTDTRSMTDVYLSYQENPNPSISLDRIGELEIGELEIGDTGTIGYTTCKATDPVVTLSSSNSDVLSIDDDGKYTCKAPGPVTITANMTCTEGSASASVDLMVNTGLITIAKANELGSQISSGTISEYIATIKGYITNLNPDDSLEGHLGKIALSDKKCGESDANSLNIDGIYGSNKLRDIAILDGQVTIRGKIENFDGVILLNCLEWSDFTIDAVVFADYFIDTLTGEGGACADPNKDNSEALETPWRILGNKWPYVDSTSKETLKNATAEDETYGAFVKLYDHIMSRYGETKFGEDANFVGRKISSNPVGAHNLLATSDDSLTITIIVLVSVLSVSLIVGTSLIVRKRKVN